MKDELSEFNDKLVEFDDDIDDGVYAVPRDPKSPRVKVRALDQYCKQHKKEPSQLSAEEMEMFLDRS
ncbi:hypothetical protein [Paenibacillus sp. FSL L8-0709]|uniref:hypothetical protein n=1 Tax=Paenibacillus sp. FSL L8-0709 TaxID=2975312 RepID=UPI0030F5B68B